MAPSSIPGPLERRTSRRSALQRRALVHGQVAIIEATVVDMSSTGLRMFTSGAIFPGAVLEMEIYHGDRVDGSTPDDVQVMVVRVEPAGGGVFDVGCSYRHKSDAPAPSILHRPTEAKPRAAHIRVIEEAPMASANRSAMDKRILTALLLLLMLLVAGGLVVITALLIDRITGREAPQVSDTFIQQQQRASMQPNETDPAPSASSVSGPLEEVAFRDPLIATHELDLGMAALREGDFNRARDTFAQLQRDESINTTERAQASVGLALAFAALGDLNASERSIEALLSSDSGAPETWIAVAQQISAQIALGNVQGIEKLMFVAGFEIAPAPPGFTADSPMRLVVDRNGYTLTVIEDGSPVGTYPVGIGHGETTPAGEFTIANKIALPIWFNRGNPIPPGDPENPLGDSWMGLGDERGPTPVGIHPTDDASSIAANKSAGCIRMRPNDAAALFARCEVGTPVTIQ